MTASITEYVSYFEAGEDMTDEEYGKYMRTIHNFAFCDIEPDYSVLPPLVKAALRTVIASVRKNKEDRQNGSKGGAPIGNSNAKKTTPVVSKKQPLIENKNNPCCFFETSNEKEKENENEKEKENDDDEKCEIPKNLMPPSSSPSFLTPSLEKYGHIVFEKFRDNDLPCQKGNEFAFLSCDFKNALSKLKGLNSNDVLQAVDNYIAELNNPESYITYRYSFDAFVNSKNFIKLLPANYVHENFRSYGKSVKSELAKEAEDKRHEEQVSARKRLLSAHPVRCDVCGCELQDSSAGFGRTWMCRNCNSEWELKDGQWIKDG